MADNKLGMNIILGRLAAFLPSIATSTTVPPTDGSADTAVNGSIALTASGLYIRVVNVWRQVTTNTNSASGRFLTGTAAFAGTANTLTVSPAPTGAVNGDTVFVSANPSALNTNAAVVYYSGAIVGGDLVITARASGGALQATAGLPAINYMIDTAT